MGNQTQGVRMAYFIVGLFATTQINPSKPAPTKGTRAHLSRQPMQLRVHNSTHEDQSPNSPNRTGLATPFG